MKKRTQKLSLGKEIISNLNQENIIGGQQSVGKTCFVTSCGCPKSVNSNGKCFAAASPLEG